jgi:hypothetical protein
LRDELAQSLDDARAAASEDAQLVSRAPGTVESCSPVARALERRD